jgi:hypothetical protein
MEQGVVFLESLYQEFVRKYAADLEAYRIDGSSSLGNRYSKKCNELMTDAKVPHDQQGFYLWGFYNPKRFWINVYLGKAGKGIGAGRTDTLKIRLYKELTAERACVWREGNSSNARSLEIGKEIHPTMWPKYKSHWVRALRKAGSTHIFWVAKPELKDLVKEDVELIESDLVEAMNPTGNRMRRLPSLTRRKEAEAVFSTFREMIHRDEYRKTSFPLRYHKEFWKWVGESQPTEP